ncbi:hypothetical protein A1507_03690 [Methylomonas koyamae]|uniref:Uncharacterized protein n=1 Tax=Methylomonas koyamae TaxID=702114 RepID=A0A177MXI1_9GAMM|nr:hypothetical protein A1507_03690 [Methylomonas koyamae]
MCSAERVKPRFLLAMFNVCQQKQRRIKEGYVRVSNWRRPGIPKGHKRIAGAQKPRMAKFQHILVPWIPAIHAGMTASISFN